MRQTDRNPEQPAIPLQLPSLDTIAATTRQFRRLLELTQPDQANNGENTAQRRLSQIAAATRTLARTYGIETNPNNNLPTNQLIPGSPAAALTDLTTIAYLAHTTPTNDDPR